MKQKFTLLLAILCCLQLDAQSPKKWTSSSIHEALHKLNFLGSVLYLAAHPDDENTRLISYLSNVRHAETAYLSLTRGDGGQNLIGSEIREQLGVIRTQELLAARRIDAGKQFFSRANDFGYSKHPKETFNIWDKDQVMEDAIWVIRNFKPDVIINRFDHRTPGKSHGHHTASAMISVESFDISGDKTAYPDQLKYVAPWQPERIFMNTSWWFYGSREAFEAADKSNMVSVDVGTYLPKRGESVTEIAARSRSQHKSQGFGSSGSRGEREEYLELVAGTMPKGAEDLFTGINTTWTRVKGGESVGKAIDKAIANFDFDQPENNISQLLAIRSSIEALADGHWKRIKSQEINEIIEGCLGLFLEASSKDASASPGQRITLNFEAINRSTASLELEHIHIKQLAKDSSMMLALSNNQNHQWSMQFDLPTDMPITNAYWLNQKASLGMYTVNEQELIGQAQTPAAIQVDFLLKVKNSATGKSEKLQITKDVVFKSTDPVKGERYSPFEITPAAFVALDEQVYIFSDTRPQEISVTVGSERDQINGKLTLEHPESWKVEPAYYDVSLNKKGQESQFKFTLYPPKGQEEANIYPKLSVGEQDFTRRKLKITYDHIPTQTLLLDAKAKVVRLEIEKKGQYIGYLMGAGDDIPQALEQIGYSVSLLEDRDMNLERLKTFDAVIIGVRAYNTLDRMPIYQDHLMKYVEEGGTLIVQYNTHRRLKVPNGEIGPYPFTISRDRVTVEEAKVNILAPEHAVMNTPNKITAKDFEGWVQERGLYFPNEWSDEYTPILSCHDPDESAKKGGLLVAEYGEGHYIYTGYSWFRELPAGVAGAYRIFTNLISLGNDAKP